MKCLRCQNEMKYYELEPSIKVQGTLNKSQHPFTPDIMYFHDINSVYICDNCGYTEFSTNICENSDI